MASPIVVRPEELDDDKPKTLTVRPEELDQDSVAQPATLQASAPAAQPQPKPQDNVFMNPAAKATSPKPDALDYFGKPATADTFAAQQPKPEPTPKATPFYQYEPVPNVNADMENVGTDYIPSQQVPEFKKQYDRAMEERLHRDDGHLTLGSVVSPENVKRAYEQASVSGIAPAGDLIRTELAKAPRDESNVVLNTITDLGLVSGDAIQGLSTPKNAAILGAMALLPRSGPGALVKTLVDAGFTVEMATSAGEEIAAGIRSYETGDIEGAKKHFSGAGTSALFSLMSAQGIREHAAGERAEMAQRLQSELRGEAPNLVDRSKISATPLGLEQPTAAPVEPKVTPAAEAPRAPITVRPEELDSSDANVRGLAKQVGEKDGPTAVILPDEKVPKLGRYAKVLEVDGKRVVYDSRKISEEALKAKFQAGEQADVLHPQQGKNYPKTVRPEELDTTQEAPGEALPNKGGSEPTTAPLASGEPVLQEPAPSESIPESSGGGLNYSPQELADFVAKRGAKDAPQMVGEKPTVTVRPEEVEPVTSQAQLPPPGQVGAAKVADLQLAPKMFQYKLGTDEAGTTNRLKDTHWDPKLAGTISVWTDPKTGATYVVNGHHRFDLAKRSGAENINVFHIEADTPERARAIGALQNIAEGRGTAIDAAKFMRDSKLSAQDLASEGVSLGEKTAAKGIALSKLDDSLFDQVVQGKLPERIGVAIGESTDDPAIQRAIAERVAKEESRGRRMEADAVREMVDFAKGAGTKTESMESLFGTLEDTRSLLAEKAEVSAAIKRDIEADRKIFGAVASEKKAEVLSKGKNVINAGENARISKEAAQALELYDKFKNTAGPVSDILNQAAKELADGRSKAQVVSEASGRIREELRRTLAGGQESRPQELQANAAAGSGQERPAVEPPRADQSGTVKPSFYKSHEDRVSKLVDGSEVTVDTSGSQPEIEVNDAAHSLFSQVLFDGFTDWAGANLSARDAQSYAERLRDTANRYHPDIANQIKGVADALDKAAEVASEAGIRLRLENPFESKEAVRAHEDLHGGQRALGKGHLSDHVDVDAMAKNPLHEKITSNLQEMYGYKGDAAEAVAEAPVHILTDRDIGLTPEEKLRYVLDYENALRARHGDDALQNHPHPLVQNLIKAISGYSKEAQDALRQTQPGGEGTLPGEVRSSAADRGEPGREAEGSRDAEAAGRDTQRQVGERTSLPAESEQGKSDVLPSGKGPGKRDVAFQTRERERELAKPFYSQAEKIAQQKLPESILSSAVEPTLRNNGVKPEELKWLGLDDFLKNKGKVSKQEVLDFIRQNNVQVKEVEKSNSQKMVIEYSGNGFSIVDPDSNGILAGPFDSRSKAQSWVETHHDEGGRTKFASYQLPGGGNYREMLLTLPEKSGGTPNIVPSKDHPGNFEVQGDSGVGYFSTRERAAEAAAKYSTTGSSAFKSSHFDEPNVLAHVRFNDRTDAQGKKVLFLEEVQSDWHQKGRKQGYAPSASEKTPYPPNYNDWALAHGMSPQEIGETWNTDDSRYLQWKEESDAGFRSRIAQEQAVPDAPFKKTWHELALKRMLRYAAENGYDKLAWTPGEVQNDRYDLSKHVDEVVWTPTESGRGELTAWKNKERVIATEIPQSELADHVGKDVAERLVVAPQQKLYGKMRHVLGGVDLKVGGSGMKGFYDKIIPEFLNKYGKKWGANVGETTIEAPSSDIAHKRFALRNPNGEIANQFPTREEAQRSADNLIKNGAGNWKPGMQWTVEDSFPESQKGAPAIDITPEMKESVLHEGQPIFMAGRSYGEGLEDDDLRKFVKDAGRKIDVEKAGAQPMLFGGEEAQFKLINRKTGESVLVPESRFGRLFPTQKWFEVRDKEGNLDQFYRTKEEAEARKAERGGEISEVESHPEWGDLHAKLGQQPLFMARANQRQRRLSFGLQEAISNDKRSGAYDKIIDSLLEKTEMGKPNPQVRRFDPEAADLKTQLDASGQFHKAVATKIAENVTGNLKEEPKSKGLLDLQEANRITRDRLKGFHFLADKENREWLAENRNSDYQRWSNDPKIEAAVAAYKPYEEQLRAAVKKLGGKTIDEDYIKRVMDFVTGGIDQPEAKTKAAGVGGRDSTVSPQVDRSKSRKDNGEFYWNHGVFDFGPSFEKRWVEVMSKLDEHQLAVHAMGKGVRLDSGDQLPASIHYNGQVFYRPDVAREIREVARNGKSAESKMLAQSLGVEELVSPKEVHEYGVYEPFKGGRFESAATNLAKGVIGESEAAKGQAVNLLKMRGTKLAVPKEIADTLNNVEPQQGRMSQVVSRILSPVTQLIRQQIVGFGYGVPHMGNVLRKVMQQMPGGAVNPKAWIEAGRVAFSKELHERGIDGVNDPAYKELLRNAGISEGAIPEYKHYVEANLNPKTWANAFREGGKAGNPVTAKSALAGLPRLAFEPLNRFSEAGHANLFKTGGIDQRARLWLYDRLKSADPGMKDADIAHAVNQAFGRYNRASWTDVQRGLAPFLMFPGWDMSSVTYAMQHPIKTSLPPAVLILLSNYALNSAGLNDDKDKNDPFRVHVGHYAVKSNLVSDNMGSHLTEFAYRAARAKMDRKSNSEAANDAARGAAHGLAGLTVNTLNPVLGGVADVAYNRKFGGSGKEIDSHKKKPYQAVKDYGAFVAGKAVPSYERSQEGDGSLKSKLLNAGSGLAGISIVNTQKKRHGR